jgi:hypothetical protein
VSDAALPTWDQIVYRVSIQSNYLMLLDSAQRWREALKEMETVRDKLLELAGKTSDRWEGEGSAAVRQHLADLARAMETTRVRHQAVAGVLEQLSDYVRRTVYAIPIPSWRYDEVQQKQALFARTGVPPHLEPATLYQWQHWIAPSTDGLIEGRFHIWYSQAESAYMGLESWYHKEAAALPPATPVTPPGVGQPGAGRNGAVSGGRGAKTAGADALNGGLGAGLSPGGLQAPASTAGLNSPSVPTASLPDTQPPDLPTTPPPDPSGITDLPGASGLPNAGGLPAIADPAKSGLAGLGKLGGGGGGGLPGLGPSAELPSAVTAGFGSPGSSGPGGLGAAGGAGSGLKAGTSPMGMYPPMSPMGGAGQQGPGNNADSSLHEDEVKVMFGFEPGHSGEQQPEIPGGGVLEA